MYQLPATRQTKLKDKDFDRKVIVSMTFNLELNLTNAIGSKEVEAPTKQMAARPT